MSLENSLVNVALYHIHHIWHYRVRLRESGQPIGRLRKTCKNAFPRTIPVSFGRLDTPIATESSLNRTGESSQQEIRKLLTGEELGDRKPSELLRTMNRRVASHNVPKELMLELFLQQLPTSVQTILASITPITVEKATEVADRILEGSTPNVSFSTNAIVSSSENCILQEIERLNKRVDDLTMRQRTPERRNNSRPRNRSRNRSFSRSGNLVCVCCWYHKKFQERGKKCIPPCCYKKRIQRGVIATTFSQPHISRRLFIKDKSSNTAFLIDTRSDVSVLPASISEKRKATVFSNYQPLTHLLSTFICQNWFAKFRSGNFDVEDAPRSGRPVEADEDAIKALVDANRRITTREIGLRLNLSNSTVYDHFKGLGLSSKLDVWVPDVLTERNLCRRIDVCDSLLKRHENDSFLKRIITGNEKGHGAKKMNRLKPFPKPIFTKKGDAVGLVGF
ncbi:histone-lysine N-methyltransferase SETMAR [Trichonephila clavipes]|nr:histone-lysine N-methyltransferase SETMAR [Trichonephila clavipes]